MWKTGYHLLYNITMTQDTLKGSIALKWFMACVFLVTSTLDTDMWRIKCHIFKWSYVETYEKTARYVSIITSFFLVYSLSVGSGCGAEKDNIILSGGRRQWTIQHKNIYTHNNLLWGIGVSHSYLVLVLGYKYVDNFHNNTTQVSSVVTHFETVGRRTLYP